MDDRRRAQVRAAKKARRQRKAQLAETVDRLWQQIVAKRQARREKARAYRARKKAQADDLP